jgi:hypothetical protein
MADLHIMRCLAAARLNDAKYFRGFVGLKPGQTPEDSKNDQAAGRR